MKPNKNQNPVIIWGLPSLLVIGGLLFSKPEYHPLMAFFTGILFLIENILEIKMDE